MKSEVGSDQGSESGDDLMSDVRSMNSENRSELGESVNNDGIFNSSEMKNALSAFQRRGSHASRSGSMARSSRSNHGVPESAKMRTFLVTLSVDDKSSLVLLNNSNNIMYVNSKAGTLLGLTTFKPGRTNMSQFIFNFDFYVDQVKRYMALDHTGKITYPSFNT
jgi:hypothetical protein